MSAAGPSIETVFEPPSLGWAPAFPSVPLGLKPGVGVSPSHGHTALEPIAIPVTGINRDIQVKIASTPDEWEQAHQLVFERYRDRGYLGEESAGLHFTLYHALPDTVTFIAKEGDTVITTMSLVPDNTLLGLPMESTYRNEIDALRMQGRRLNEVTCLADAELSLRHFVPVFMALSRLLLQYNAHRGSNELVIEVNPRHVKFYQKVWGFVPIGPRRACPAVQGAPAEAFYMNIDLMNANAPKTYQFAYSEPLPLEALATPRPPRSTVLDLANQSCRTNLHDVNEVLDFIESYGSPRRW